MIVGNALWQLVAQSDGMTKAVLLLLLVMSIACWTIFFYKLMLFRLKKQQLDQAIEHLGDNKDTEQLLIFVDRLSGTLPGYFLSKQFSCIKDFLQKRKQAEQYRLTADDVIAVREQAYATIDDLMYYEDAYLSVLSTSAALSPLLGLFGTVWGLIHAFVRISEKQAADITTVAPGLAEALITTLAGLMVAMPALAMYNYLSSQVNVIEQRCMTLTTTFMSLVHRLFA